MAVNILAGRIRQMRSTFDLHPLNSTPKLKPTDLFDTLQKTTLDNGASVAAQLLVNEMRSQERYPELFESLKMLHRIELGLPAVHTDLSGAHSESMHEVISPELQDQLDKKLLGACTEVGAAMMRKGNLQEGWMYMRAVGDRAATAEAMRDVPVTQENLDTFLGLLVHEAIDVARGTKLSLEMRGTCNTITMLDSVVSMRGRVDQQAAVGTLVEHVHAELLESLKSDIIRREKSDASSDVRTASSLEFLLSTRPTLLRDGTYHLDTTHLASTVRFARILDNEAQIRLAVDLAQYGRQLHSQYQYPSEEPFTDLYPMSLGMFRALLGEHVDAALKMFLQKAESLDPQEHGTVAIETYADLLTRVGRPAEAMQFLIKKMPRGMRPFGIAPSLLELAEASKDFQLMLDHAKERGDFVGYAAALLQSVTYANKSPKVVSQPA
ncbi:MAG: hypothetical protein NTY15_16095 [Planctomycetota bacterium]|nr:hypothetical protein [Planctomycetota bacterium]